MVTHVRFPARKVHEYVLEFTALTFLCDKATKGRHCAGKVLAFAFSTQHRVRNRVDITTNTSTHLYSFRFFNCTRDILLGA